MTTPGIRRRIELLDGGTGEELFRRGMPDDRKIWSAGALVHPEHHELLVDVHGSFLRAGSDFITCNNYGVTPGVSFSEEEIVKYCDVAGRLAQRARASKPSSRICGSLPPLLESYRPDRLVEFDDGLHLYSVIGSALRPYVDLFLGETLSTVEEAKMAILGVQDLQKPVMISFTLNTKGQLRSGMSADDAIRELIHFTTFYASTTRMHGVLFNCSQPEAISQALRCVQANEDLATSLQERDIRLGAYANRLTVIPEDWALAESSEPQAMRTDLEVEQYLRFVMEWIDLGAEIIGGCCGIGPEYIESIHNTLQAQGHRE
ncbi:hypothetical protein Poli38472_005139 [Pythium oligandrum]|uniref:Hcy-binding domain-containing protein n=1 Tax=Pythium oligandrum TaxID=41045 RepID=A0A8K1FHA9_PYTOL|nr:hypothetical protein Poli38472_005139 [Pythium oligandrum]|eukprot:TMW62521.1 hypothetical protein Poli38472_005139 [Pythium oligandrum]